jgi:hypothetical protein
LSNQASDTYELFINERSQGDIAPGTFINRSLNEGTYNFRAVQKDGFALYPTEYKDDFVIKAGEDREWSWGNLIMR